MKEIPTLPKYISLQVAIAILLGSILGIFLRHQVSFLIPVEKAFDMFLQTIIVIYVPMSLMHGLGALRAQEAGKLLIKAVAFLLCLWLVMLASCYLAELFIPPSQAVVYHPLYTGGLTKELMRYLIPQNPFSDAIHNILPPVAFFSLILGAAFSHEKTKEPLLSLLEKGAFLMETMMVWLVIVAPIKACLHFAIIGGHLDFEMLAPIRFYIAAIVVITLFLSFFFLPMLVSLLTPLTYREVIKRFSFIGLISFGTGQPLIAFPLIREILRKIRIKHHFSFSGWNVTYLLIAPLAFSFAQLGNMLSLLFAQYFAYFFHAPLNIAQKLILPFFAILLTIGSPSSSMQNVIILAKQLDLPVQAMNYIHNITHTVVNFKVLLSTSGVFCLILIVMMLHEKKLKHLSKKLFSFLLISVLALSGLFYIARLVAPPQESDREFFTKLRLSDILPHLPPISVLPYPSESNRVPLAQPQNVLAKILERKTIRVGFEPGMIPFSYINKWGDVVGFDVAFMAQLAYELNLELELMPLQIDHLEEDLNAGLFDIAVGGIVMDSFRLRSLFFSDFYHQQHNYLVVPHEYANQFMDLSSIKKRHGLKIAAIGAIKRIAKNHFPLAQIVSVDSFDDPWEREADVFIGMAAPSSLLALQNPHLASIDFGPQLGSEYICFAMAFEQLDLQEFINEWITLKKQSGFFQTQYQYWINLEPLKKQEKRWNIIEGLIEQD